jgi:hypothetical protein
MISTPCWPMLRWYQGTRKRVNAHNMARLIVRVFECCKCSPATSLALDLDLMCATIGVWRLSARVNRMHHNLCHFLVACRSMTILFGGTSGCGKSTLASLTASRLGISTVLSTDFVRHMLRKSYSEEQEPMLYPSTYTAGEMLGGEESAGLTSKEKTLMGYRQQVRQVMMII